MIRIMTGQGNVALDQEQEVDMRVSYRHFRGAWISWQDLFRQAAAFATEVGPENLISISHSSDNNDGVVTVWFWERE